MGAHRSIPYEEQIACCIILNTCSYANSLALFKSSRCIGKRRDIPPTTGVRDNQRHRHYQHQWYQELGQEACLHLYICPHYEYHQYGGPKAYTKIRWNKILVHCILRVGHFATDIGDGKPHIEVHPFNLVNL